MAPLQRTRVKGHLYQISSLCEGRSTKTNLDSGRLRVDDVLVGADGHDEGVHLGELLVAAILKIDIIMLRKTFFSAKRGENGQELSSKSILFATKCFQPLETNIAQSTEGTKTVRRWSKGANTS